MGRAILKYKVGGTSYQDFVIEKPVVTLGRSKGNDITIHESSISRLHFRVENRQGRYFILDNNSSNGTFLNRRKVREAPLKNADAIIAGRVNLVFLMEEESDEGMKTRPYSVLDSEHIPPSDSTISMTVAEDGMNPNQAAPGFDQTGDLNPYQGPFETPETSSPPPDFPPTPPAEPTHSGGDDDTIGDQQSPFPDFSSEQQQAPVPPPMPAAQQSQELDQSLRRDLPSLPEATRVGSGTLKSEILDMTPAAPLNRLIAYVLDSVVTMFFFVPSIVIGFFNMPILASIAVFLGLAALVMYVSIGWLKYGKTLGKHLMGIRIIEVTDPETHGISAKALVLRLVGYMICGIPLMLLFLAILFNEEGLGIHDKIAGTQVIKDQ